MLNSITIKFGDPVNPDILELDLDKITIFVGPNNSGKSLLLREIENFITTGATNNRLILDELKFKYPTSEDLDVFVEQFEVKGLDNPSGQKTFTRMSINNDSPDNTTVDFNFLKSEILAQSINGRSHALSQYLKYYLLRLDGSTRFMLTTPKTAGDLQSNARNHLMALFKDNKARKKIREYIFNALGLYFVIDPTSGSSASTRFLRQMTFGYSAFSYS